MFSDDDLLPISALQHLLYCERQCALIHLERLWAENRFTVEGRHLHERADAGKREARPGGRTARAVPLWSYELGLFGMADVIEYAAAPLATGHSQLATNNPQPTTGNSQPATSPVPFPVEYKRGKPKAHDADRVQLCAQAMCLDEMLGVPVPAGALFYGRTRRREDVAFDAALRALTTETAARLHELLAGGQTPPAVYERRKCERCSLKSQCLPRLPAGRAAGFLDRQLREVLAAAGPASE
ncbi:MAG TPA: CRISPR-associated protein Cas4 [Tepidisphaeraceae bacterium]|jgi:CRISPR-associated exonuclease Cas4